MKVRASDLTDILERLLAVLIGLLGLGLGAGGAYLLTLGGSAYYLPIGIAMVIAAVQIWRRRRSGHWIYAVVCLITLIWSLAEVGLNGWALLPRLDLILGLGLALLILRAVGGGGPLMRRGTAARVAVLLLVFVASLGMARGPARTTPKHTP